MILSFKKTAPSFFSGQLTFLQANDGGILRPSKPARPPVMRQLISADPHLAVEPLEALIINTMHSQDPTRQATLAGKITRLVARKPLRRPTSILCRLVTMLIDPAIKIPLPQNGLLLRLIDYIKTSVPTSPPCAELYVAQRFRLEIICYHPVYRR